MVRKRLDLSWVFLGLLICLFVWIVESPRSWDRMARPQAVLNQPILSKPAIFLSPRTPTPSPETPRAKASAQPVQRPPRKGPMASEAATLERSAPVKKIGSPSPARWHRRRRRHGCRCRRFWHRPRCRPWRRSRPRAIRRRPARKRRCQPTARRWCCVCRRSRMRRSRTNEAGPGGPAASSPGGEVQSAIGRGRRCGTRRA